MATLFLALAILFEVAGTLAMKASDGLTRAAPILVMVAAYAVAFGFLSLSLRRIEVGMAYAIWSGVGTALITAAGILVFKESMSALKLASIALIIIGVIGLKIDGG